MRLKVRVRVNLRRTIVAKKSFNLATAMQGQTFVYCIVTDRTLLLSARMNRGLLGLDRINQIGKSEAGGGNLWGEDVPIWRCRKPNGRPIVHSTNGRK